MVKYWIAKLLNKRFIANILYSWEKKAINILSCAKLALFHTFWTVKRAKNTIYSFCLACNIIYNANTCNFHVIRSAF